MEHLRANEFQRVQDLSYKQYKKLVGARPVYKEVAKTYPNPDAISILQWAAMVVLLVLTVHTSFKVGAAAVPYAQDLMRSLSSNQFIDVRVQDSFIFVSAVLFMMLATPALIYFKLLDHDERTQADKVRTQRRPFYTLDYITPRLPSALVYGIIAWLFFVSSHGFTFDSNDLVKSIARALEVYLPVLVEVGLAWLVGDVIEKRRKFSNLVHANLKETNARIDKELADYSTDKRYLSILYQNLREAFLLLERRDRMGKSLPNKQYEDDPKLDSMLLAEYRRFTQSDAFATVAALPATIELPKPTSSTKRTPSSGKWNKDTLTFDLRSRNVARPYGEKELARDYEAGYDARKAWRDGAKDF